MIVIIKQIDILLIIFHFQKTFVSTSLQLLFKYCNFAPVCIILFILNIKNYTFSIYFIIHISLYYLKFNQ